MKICQKILILALLLASNLSMQAAAKRLLEKGPTDISADIDDNPTAAKHAAIDTAPDALATSTNDEESNEAATAPALTRRNNFPCDECDKIYETNQGLITHKFTHTQAMQLASDDKRPFECYKWDATFKTVSHLNQHTIFRHTGKKPFKCDHEGCQSHFTQSSDLERHRRIHTGEKPFKCDKCDAVFKFVGHLSRHHLYRHTNDKPFACDHAGCNKAFVLISDLERHRRIHTGEKPFVCGHTDCGRAFTRSDQLTIHKYTHSGKNPFKCDHAGCDKAFTQSSDLERHRRIHTGEKPFKCDKCDAVFKFVGHLSRHHLYRHTNDKPFACDHAGCNKAFVLISDLERHRRIHTGEKPFVCGHTDCGRAFTRSELLKKHIKTTHVLPAAAGGAGAPQKEEEDDEDDDDISYAEAHKEHAPPAETIAADMIVAAPTPAASTFHALYTCTKCGEAIVGGRKQILLHSNSCKTGNN